MLQGCDLFTPCFSIIVSLGVFFPLNKEKSFWRKLVQEQEETVQPSQAV